MIRAAIAPHTEVSATRHLLRAFVVVILESPPYLITTYEIVLPNFGGHSAEVPGNHVFELEARRTGAAFACASTRLYTLGDWRIRMRATNRVWWAIVMALLCALPPLFAHHSFAAEFDGSKTVTLRGVVSKVDWINPHIFVYLDVKNDAGKTTTWSLQSLPPLFFRGSGLTKDVLLSNKQEVTVTANPARDGSAAYGFMTQLSYPDGHAFSMSPQDADPGLRKGQK
jgi:hypothetical protein